MSDDPREVVRDLVGDDVDVGVGIDCEDVDRWRKLVATLDSGSRRALFHPEEHAHCRSFPDPAPQYAGRWCAKEAVFKALSGFCRLSLRDIKILNRHDGRPYAVVSVPEFERLHAHVRLSISHTSQTATAFAVALVGRVPAETGHGPSATATLTLLG